MGSFSIWHWLLVAAVLILLFGAKKVPAAMGDLAKGIKAFKRGLNDDSDASAAAASPGVASPAPVSAPASPTPISAAQGSPSVSPGSVDSKVP